MVVATRAWPARPWRRQPGPDLYGAWASSRPAGIGADRAGGGAAMAAPLWAGVHWRDVAGVLLLAAADRTAVCVATWPGAVRELAGGAGARVAEPQAAETDLPRA